MVEKIMILDGNSLINRAFYALPMLSNKNGEYTNAVLGFMNIFLKLYDDEKPDYLAIAFDLPAPTFRHLKYEAYKATRKSMPEELRPQFPMLKKLLGLMNIAVIEAEGFEADDILGTLAVKAEGKGLKAVVVSGDRDLLQIASEHIKIRIPKTRLGKTEVEDYYGADVLAKIGVTPKEYIDVKALMGDASDNIPGVSGIGEKTALKIIQDYKSIENAIAHAAEIKPKKASENLAAQSEMAFLSKELATIDINAAIPYEQEKYRLVDIFNAKAEEEVRRLEFKSLLVRFKNSDKKGSLSQASAAKKLIVKYIGTKSGVCEISKALENSTLAAYKFIYDYNKLIGISFSYEQGSGVFIGLTRDLTEEAVFEELKNFFEGNAKKIGLDIKKDLHLLKKHGVGLKNLVFDAMIAGYILNASREKYEFNDIAFDYLQESYGEMANTGNSEKKQISLMDLMSGNNSSDNQQENNEEITEYSCIQADVLFRAYPEMAKQLEANDQKELYYEIELPLIFVLADMEIYGVKTDREFLREYGSVLGTKINILVKEIHALSGVEFNINSPKQMGEVLFEKLGIKGSKKTKTGWSTSADVLEKLIGEYEIVDKILEYRTYSKLKSTYADGLMQVIGEGGKIYSTFNQAVTATGRISSVDPNLQNIPIRTELGRQLRKAFVPSDDNFVFVDADYSQIELRILAHLSGDETFIQAFKEHEDIHRITASQVFRISPKDVTNEQRSYAKAVNFGIVYGISAFSLSDDIGVSVKEAGKYIEEYFDKYPRVREYMDRAKTEAKEKGYSKTIFNRRRQIPELASSNFVTRSFGERVAMNMPVQGSAADIIKIAMVRVHRKLAEKKLKSRLILQIHDELLIEAHKSEVEIIKNMLVEEMENAVSLSVPLSVDVNSGDSWYDAKG